MIIFLCDQYRTTMLESRTHYLTVYSKISQITSHASLRGVRDYLIESDCFQL
jgi:hypothetical protein